ncbi:MAG: protein kinase [Caldimonas sp.]
MNPEEEDRTIIRPRTGQVPAPSPDGAGVPYAPTQAMPATAPATSQPTTGAPTAPATSGHSLTLAAGTRLGEFEITKTIGEGGFGIVYLAWDHSLDRKVALKEYMPSSIAFRSGQTEIKPRSERHQETFEAGLKSFINESKLLAQFDHPSLLKVYRFWEANGTAYMVMPFLEGATVRDTVRALPVPPDEAWILGLLAPLFDALVMLHAAQIYHRDIAPDNVLLMADTGRPLLLDFGAARRVIGDMTQALTAILKPGYAPIEQYADMPGLKQGPWTDVYALAAVVHWMILGKTPSPSVGRLFDDAYVPLAQSAAGRYSDSFLQAIDRALAVMPDKRTQSIEAMRQDVFAAGTPVAVLTPLPLPAGAAPVGMPRTGAPRTGAPRTLTHPPTQTLRSDMTQQMPPRTQQQLRTQHPPEARPEPEEAPARRRSAVLPVAIGAALVVVAAVAAFVLWPRPSPAPGTTTATTPAVSPVTTAPATPASVATTPPIATVPLGQEKPTATVAPASAAMPPVALPPATLPARDPAVAEVGRPNPEPEQKTAVRKPPPAKPEARKETRERRVEPTETKVAEPKPANDNRDECAKLFQRLSLGDGDQSLIDRYRTLRCR